MPSKKLIKLLGSLSRAELNHFEKYLQSPYFNESEELELIYKLLAKKMENSKKENNVNTMLEKKHLWQQLYQTQPYNDDQMRRLLSDLTQHIFNFLAIEHLQREPIQKNILLLNKLEEKKLESHFMGIFQKTVVLCKKEAFTSGDFHLFNYMLEKYLYEFIEKYNLNPEMILNLKLADYHLDCHYVIQKLKFHCDILGYSQLMPIQGDISLIEYLLTQVQSNKFIKEPYINVYYLVIKMLLNLEEDSFYYEAKKMLKINEKFLGRTELKSLYIHLMNYCIHNKINAGKKEFLAEVFDIYKELLKRDILLENNLFNSSHYKNIITVSLQVKEFEWTEAFIQTYTPKLPPEERENALTYNLAKVYFAQQQYEKVIEQLREVEYENLTYALGGKLMLLKTYYELHEYLALDSLVDSFRVYLRRNQTISKEVRQQYLNVLRFIKKLSNVRPGDRTAIAKIETQIHECKNLADKGWIVSKVEELKEDRRVGG